MEKETINRKDLISIREYRPEDRNFILATWLRGAYYGNDFFKLIPKAIFMENYHRAVDRVISLPSTIVRVACLKEDPDVILGYSVSRDIAGIGVVDWVFVKDAWRKIGVGTMLLPRQVNAYTHVSKKGLSVLTHKKSNIIYNPFLF